MRQMQLLKRLPNNNIIFVEENGKYGAVDKTDTVIIPIIYDYIESFTENLISVRQEGKY